MTDTFYFRTMESQTHTIVFDKSAKQVHLSIYITFIAIQNTFTVYQLKLWICNTVIFMNFNMKFKINRNIFFVFFLFFEFQFDVIKKRWPWVLTCIKTIGICKEIISWKVEIYCLLVRFCTCIQEINVHVNRLKDHNMHPYFVIIKSTCISCII